MQEAKKFNLKTVVFRLFALILGALTAWGLNKESIILNKEIGSFFMTSNPSLMPVGDVLINSILTAKRSIDIQIYALSDKTLLGALNRHAKNVDIHIYYDPKASFDLSQKLDKSIKLIPYSRNHLMHRKITIIDKEVSILGSSNYTTSSLYWHNNMLALIKSPKLAEFLSLKARGLCHFEYGRAYLLPDIKNQALNDVIDVLDQAKHTVHMAMFSLTHPQILKKLSSLADRGVDIWLYLDKLNFKNTSQELQVLMQKCKKVFKQSQPVLMHHKLCLIDNKIFITGSANWSKSGFKKNEEVLVIFDKLEESEKASLPKLFLDLESTMEDQTCDAQAA